MTPGADKVLSWWTQLCLAGLVTWGRPANVGAAEFLPVLDTAVTRLSAGLFVAVPAALWSGPHPLGQRTDVARCVQTPCLRVLASCLPPVPSLPSQLL